MTNYRNGAAFELRVKADLERNGYVVIRSAGSKGAADLAAIKEGEVLFVQCKRRGPVIPPAERVALLGMSRIPGCVPVVAFMPGVRGIAYRRLTGPSAKQWVPWAADGSHPMFDDDVKESAR